MADKPRVLPRRPTDPPPKAKPTSTNTGKGPAKSSGKSSGKSSSKSNVSSAEKRAIKRENDAKKKAGQKYLEGAANLQKQAQAIRQALDVDFASARDNNLGDISLALNTQLSALKTDAGVRAQSFLTAAGDAEKATGDTAERGLTNAVRERADVLSNILEQGAGETDTMKAMLMSARNWNSNAAESNRAYFDTINTVNASITDLNVDTKQALAGQWTGAESARDEVWQTFYNSRNQAFTQLGNILGQEAEMYASAKEMGVKPKKGAEKAAEDAMNKAFKDSAVEAGKSYTQQGLPTWISDYSGQEKVLAKQSNTDLAAAVTMDKVAKAEGATLRKWDAA
ncbi:MAG: hypothetical protein ACOYB3_02020 [Azonexus sp.]